MSQLQGIELTYHIHGLDRLKAEMFNEWLKSPQNSPWIDLVTALEAMGEDRVASNITRAARTGIHLCTAPAQLYTQHKLALTANVLLSFIIRHNFCFVASYEIF